MKADIIKKKKQQEKSVNKKERVEFDKLPRKV